MIRWSRTLLLHWNLAAALAAGLFLRLYQIGAQIVADDEWHAVHALLSSSYPGVLSHFGVADHCIPLTFFYKVIADSIGLNEWLMRLPMLAFGIAALVVFPLLVRDQIGRPASEALAWLLAISPLHIYYSRYARPYAISQFLAFLCVIAFYNWCFRERDRWAVVYILCAVLAPYFHLTTAPIVFAPVLFGLFSKPARTRRAIVKIISIGAMVAAGWLLLLGPPLVVDFQSLASKAKGMPATAETLVGVVQLFAGSQYLWVALILLAALVIGVQRLARTQRIFLIYLSVLVGVQVLAMLIIRPTAGHVPMVLARYLFVLLPLVLLLVAITLARADELISRRLRVHLQGLAAIVLAGLLVYWGPLPAVYYHPNNWTNHAVFQYSYDPEGPYSYTHMLRPRRFSRFYEQLKSFAPASRLIIEAPWYYEWNNNPFPFYQQIHRQRILGGFLPYRYPRGGSADLPLEQRQLRFKNFVRISDKEGLRRRGVHYVIFHRNLRHELPDYHDPERLPPPTVQSIDLARLLRDYTSAFGNPVYEDDYIVVFAIVDDTADQG